MLDFKTIVFITSIVIFAFTSCKKEITQETIYDHIIYQVDTVAVYSSGTEKDRLKTPLQYISSIYSNLYYSSIPSNVLDNLVIYRYSIGDKSLVNEMILNAMLQDAVVQENIPTEDEMRADVNDFVQTSYLRFFLRNPTEYEKYTMKNMIDEDVSITPTDIYRAFLLSNEYMFY